MTHPKRTMAELFRLLSASEKELWSTHRIREAGGYATRLVAEALGAHVLTNGVNKGYDLTDASLGRIEVRSRRYPFDGRREDRVQVPTAKQGLFDHFVHVVFNETYEIAGAYLAPHDPIDVLASRDRRRYIRFADGRGLPQAIDLTAEVRRVQASL